MKIGQICFTKFDTVKCNEFEIPNKVFFDKFNKLIFDEEKVFRVNYDTEKDRYTIIYDGMEYTVMDGKEYLTSSSENVLVLEELNNLVEKCKKIEKLNSEEVDSIKKNNERRLKILDIAKSKSAHTFEERKTMLEESISDYEEHKTKLIDFVLDFFEDMNSGGWLSGHYRFYGGMIALLIFGVLWIVIPFFKWFFIAAAVVGLDGFLTISLFDNYFDWAGIIPFIGSIIGFPFAAIYGVGKKIYERIKYYCENIQLMKIIKKEEKILRGEEITKKRALKKIKNIKEISEFLEKLNTNNKDQEYNLETTVETTDELKNNILLIKDKKLSKQFAKDLYEIINSYVDATRNPRIVNKEKVLKNMFSQITDLSKRVNEELRIEKNQETAKNECNELIETINYQKSIGSR